MPDNRYKIVYNNKGRLTSHPETVKAGIGFTYEQGQKYGLPETGPFLCWVTLNSARLFLDGINPKVRDHYQIWEVEAELWDFDVDQIGYGITAQFLNRQNAVAFWSKMANATESERRTYLTERGASIESGSCFVKYSPRKTACGVVPWEYGTVLCKSIKLVKKVI